MKKNHSLQGGAGCLLLASLLFLPTCALHKKTIQKEAKTLLVMLVVTVDRKGTKKQKSTAFFQSICHRKRWLL